MGEVYDVLGTRKKHHVMQDTWGHLYPKPGSKHHGYFLVAYSADFGTTTMLASEFKTLDCSPIRHMLELDFLHNLELPKKETAVYLIHCTTWFYKTSSEAYLGNKVGKVINKKIKKVFSSKNFNVIP